jgi:hypothetical protein
MTRPPRSSAENPFSRPVIPDAEDEHAGVVPGEDVENVRKPRGLSRRAFRAGPNPRAPGPRHTGRPARPPATHVRPQPHQRLPSTPASLHEHASVANRTACPGSYNVLRPEREPRRRSVGVVAPLALSQRVHEMGLVPGQHSVEQLMSTALNQTFHDVHDRVHLWHSDAGECDFDAGVGEDRVEQRWVFAVAVADQVAGSVDIASRRLRRLTSCARGRSSSSSRAQVGTPARVRTSDVPGHEAAGVTMVRRPGNARTRSLHNLGADHDESPSHDATVALWPLGRPPRRAEPDSRRDHQPHPPAAAGANPRRGREVPAPGLSRAPATRYG